MTKLKETFEFSEDSYFGFQIDENTFRKVNRNSFEGIDYEDICICNSGYTRFNKRKLDLTKFIDNLNTGNVLKVSPFLSNEIDFNKLPYRVSLVDERNEDYRYSYQTSDNYILKEKFFTLEPFTRKAHRIACVFVKYTNNEKYKWGIFCTFEDEDKIDYNMHNNDINVSCLGVLKDSLIYDIYEDQLSSQTKSEYVIQEV